MSKFILEKLHLAQVRYFSSSTLESLNRCSFTVKYMIDTCGLTRERALSASKHVKFRTANQPDSVLAFLRDQGFTQIQISKVLTSIPSLLLSNPEKTFLPKIEFLKSKGIPSSEIISLVYRSPTILAMSLEDRLIPCFDFFTNFVQSEEKANTAFKRFLMFPSSHFEVFVKENIGMLKQAGVPDKNIENYVTHRPTALFTSSDKCQEVLEEIKKLGFSPSDVSFLIAFQTLKSMTKETLERKIEVFKQWDWSEDDIVGAFRKYPWCMALSVGKITLAMEFLVNKMKLQPSSLADRPDVLSMSLEKRIIPRCIIYQALVSKGLQKAGDTCLITMIKYPEKYFLERTIGRHDDDASELLKLYKQKVDLAK